MPTKLTDYLMQYETVVVDIDGCLYDFVGAWLDNCKGSYPIETTRNDIQNWYFYRDFGFNGEMFAASLSRLPYESTDYTQKEYAPAIVDAVNECYSAGKGVLFVTARDPKYREATVEFLTQLFPIIHVEHFLLMGATDKVAAIRRASSSVTEDIVCIEDGPHHVTNLNDYFDVVMVPHPYNTDSNTPSSEFPYSILRTDGTVLPVVASSLGLSLFQFFEGEGFFEGEKVSTNDSGIYVDLLRDDRQEGDALRFNRGKADLHYMMTMDRGMDALAAVFEQGAIKYAEYNYARGASTKEYLASALRHLKQATMAFALGRSPYDPETGCLHLAHACWNMLAAIDFGHETKDIPVRDPEFDQKAYERKWNK